MSEATNRRPIKYCLQALFMWVCLFVPGIATAVVQFQAELTDIPSIRGASFEFITIEGETNDVAVDPNGVIVLPGLSDLDLVRGGALQVRPINGSPMFTVTVPMSWDGEVPLVLDVDTQTLMPSPDVPLRSFSDFTGVLGHSSDLVIDNRPLHYINHRFEDMRGIAAELGVPSYALDASEVVIRRWFLQFWLRYAVANLSMDQSQFNVHSSLLVAQILYGLLAINNPDADTSGLSADPCRVVNTEALIDVPVPVSPITADDLRRQLRTEDFIFAGEVSQTYPMQLQGARVQLVAQRNPYASVDPYWNTEDALPPMVAFVDLQGRYRLRLPRPLFVSGPQQTLPDRPERFPPRMVSTLDFEEPGLDVEMLDAVIESYYRDNPMQLMTANACYQGRMVDLDFEYLFGTD